MRKTYAMFKWIAAASIIAGMASCGSTKMVSPKISSKNDISAIREGDVLTLTTTGSAGAVYKWTGPNGQASKDTMSNTWVINLSGNPAQYSGQYQVTEILRKGSKTIGMATDTMTIKVKGVPVCEKTSATSFAFKKAGKYKITILDVDIHTTTLTGYSLCLQGDQCVSLDPNTNNTKCIDRPGSPNSYIVNCTGGCPFGIVETQYHTTGTFNSMVVDNAQDLENNILTFNDGKGFTIKMKAEPVY